MEWGLATLPSARAYVFFCLKKIIRQSGVVEFQRTHCSPSCKINACTDQMVMSVRSTIWMNYFESDNRVTSIPSFASHCAILPSNWDAASQPIFHLHLHFLQFPQYLLFVTWNYLPLPILWGRLGFHSSPQQITIWISFLPPTRRQPFSCQHNRWTYLEYCYGSLNEKHSRDPSHINKGDQAAARSWN